jgi:putative transcriptional regulator
MHILYYKMQNILDIMTNIYYITAVENMKMKLARVAKGLSQQQLADQVGATRQTIGLIEKSKYNPSLNLCLKIARALDKTLDELFWEEV